MKSPLNRREAEAQEYGRVRPRTLKVRSLPGDTTLQRHACFFDDNGDRGVGVAECARGLKALGLLSGVAEAAALAIVAPLSIRTRRSLLAMNIDIEKIQKAKHDSDSGVLDKRGWFNAKRFEKVFGDRAKFKRNGRKAFAAADLTRIVKANRETFVRSLVSTAEWQLLLALAADKMVVEAGKTVPALSVARIKSFYDGTLVHKLAKELA